MAKHSALYPETDWCGVLFDLQMTCILLERYVLILFFTKSKNLETLLFQGFCWYVAPKKISLVKLI